MVKTRLGLQSIVSMSTKTNEQLHNVLALSHWLAYKTNVRANIQYLCKRMVGKMAPLKHSINDKKIKNI